MERISGLLEQETLTASKGSGLSVVVYRIALFLNTL